MLGVLIQDNGGDTAVVTDGKLEVSVTGVNFPDATLYIPGYATELTLLGVETAVGTVTTALAGVATQTTLAAMNAKIPASPATSGNQDTEIGHLSNILDAVDSIDGNVATAAKQDVANAALTKLVGATTPVVYNIALTLADTEYSQAIPTNARSVEFWSRGGYVTRFAFETGKVATPTAPYMSLKANSAYQPLGQLDLSGKTIYFATETAGDVVELIAWS